MLRLSQKCTSPSIRLRARVCFYAMCILAMLSLSINCGNEVLEEPTLSKDGQAETGVLMLLMQSYGAVGVRDEFLIVAFNPRLMQSVVVKRLSGDEAFSVYGVGRDTLPTGSSPEKQYIKVGTEKPQNYSLYYTRSRKGQAHAIFAIEVFADGRDKKTISNPFDCSFYSDNGRIFCSDISDLEPDQPRKMGVYSFFLETGLSNIDLYDYSNPIVGFDEDTLYCFGRRSEHGIPFVSYNTASKKMATIEHLNEFRIVGAGNVSEKLGWVATRAQGMKPGGYTAFISLDTGEIIPQALPVSMVIKVIDVV